MRPDRPAVPARSGPPRARPAPRGPAGRRPGTSRGRRLVVGLVLALAATVPALTAAPPATASPGAPAVGTATVGTAIVGAPAVGAGAPVALPATPPGLQDLVVPVLNCIVIDSDRSYRAVFGYTNRTSSTITLPRGLTNFMLPGNLNGVQPTTFRPGTHQGVFATSHQGRNHWVTWTVLGTSATATAFSTRCGPDVTLPTEGNGMGPVIVLVVSTALSVVAAAVHRRRRRRAELLVPTR